MTSPSYRELTARERDLLVWLLKHSPGALRLYLPQLDVAEVRSSCRCGCPSIEFSIPVETPAVFQPPAFRASFVGRSGDYDVTVMLTAGAGTLSGLEVSAIQDHEAPFDLPNVDTLSFVQAH